MEGSLLERLLDFLHSQRKGRGPDEADQLQIDIRAQEHLSMPEYNQSFVCTRSNHNCQSANKTPEAQNTASFV